MKNKFSVIISVIALCVALACLACCIVMICKDCKSGKDVQYVLYLGTNGKDTNQPVFEPEEAKDVLKDILIEYMGGYTIQEANGGWIGEDGTEFKEYTLVIYLSDTDLDKVHKLCDRLIEVFDQSSVLIQANRTTTEFYAGGSGS